MVKAVSLFSGSLASVLATRILLEESKVDEVALLSFRSPFFEDYDRVKETAEELWPGVKFRSQSVKKCCEELSNISEGNRPILSRSCRGCRTLLIGKGKRFMERVNADFLVTGEIVGTHGIDEEELLAIEHRADSKGLVYRPLSSGLSPASLPERRGWVKEGFSLRADGALAEELKRMAQGYGIDPERHDFPAEQRCKLTDEVYRRRLKNLLAESTFTTNALKLLEFDHYYKVPPDTKIVLGMTEREKRELQNFFLPRDLRFYLPSHGGPMTLVRANWDRKGEEETEGIIELAARITALKSDAPRLSKVPVNYRFEHDSETYRLDVSPLDEDRLDEYRIDPRISTS